MAKGSKKLNWVRIKKDNGLKLEDIMTGTGLGKATVSAALNGRYTHNTKILLNEYFSKF